MKLRAVGMTEDKGVMVVASGMSVTSIYAQHVQNNDHATQNMLKPDSPCCLAIRQKLNICLC